MEETERDCLLFALYATVGEILEKHKKGPLFGTTNDESTSLCENVYNILHHGSSVQVTPDTVDFWPFIEGLLTVQPCLASLYKKFDRKRFLSNGERCQAWIRHSLEENSLGSHLAILVASQDHLERNYHDFAFLRHRHHFAAMRDCLRALEQEDMNRLPDLSEFTNIGMSGPLDLSPPDVVVRPHCGSIPSGYDSGVEFAENRKMMNASSFVPVNPVSSVGLSQAVGSLKTTRSVAMALEHHEGRDKSPSNAVMLLEKLKDGKARSYSLRKDEEEEEDPGEFDGEESNSEEEDDNDDEVDGGSDAEKSLDPSFVRLNVDELEENKGGEEVEESKDKEVGTESLLNMMGSPKLVSATNLERDNSHFIVSDCIISAVEELRSIEEEKRAFRIVAEEEKQYVRWRKSSEMKNDETDDSNSEKEYELSEEPKSPCSLRDHRSSSMASLFNVSDFQSVSRTRANSVASQRLAGKNSAEAVGQSMLDLFSDKELPPHSEMQHLILARDNYFRQVTSSYNTTVVDDESQVWGEASRVRGTSDWAPPRPQIIFFVHPTVKRKQAMAKQNFRCAGCGLRVEAQHMKYFRYCEYTGKYFCSSCHTRKMYIIPGRILQKWDFRQFSVSNHAHELLTRIFNDPIFNVAAANRALLRKVRDLAVATSVREQLHRMESFVKACRLADSLVPDFRRFGYLISSSEHALYSLKDLFRLNRGDLLPSLKDLAERALSHFDGCLLCQARGFVCEVCKDFKDIIFPFQTRKCAQCPECRNCFHSRCFESVKNQCSRCERMRARKLKGNEESEKPQ
ncbi:run domain Beclin-1-interacting and cysteine-rich domain-containing protein-like [Oscarella lobularis]|uniref:run domain Beclin-1-interacting and cysteine-rich domain-containing protein-like n=1 Tax=Oscarella lobularis TaxID=121494 RepID=UPI00331426A3